MSSASPTIQEALKSHREGDFAAARRMYEQILKHEPRHAHAMSFLGLLVGQAGDWAVALEYARRAVDIDGSQPALWVNLAEAHRALGQLAEAEGFYRRALDLAPTSAELHNTYATVLQQRGRLVEAIAAYNEAVRLNPRFAEAQCNLGTAHQRQGNVEQSESCIRRALEIEPDHVRALNSLGTLLADRGRWPEAQGCWQRAVALQPTFAEAHYNLGNAFQAQGQLQQAIAAYREALRHKGDYVEALCNLGNALREDRQLEPAREVLEQAVRLRGDFAPAHNNLGNVLQDLARLEEAAACFVRAIELAPNQPEFHLNLGSVLKDQGHLPSALFAYESSLRLRPDFPEARHRRGMALLALGRFTEGWSDYEARCRCPQVYMRHFSQPQWTGEPLQGRTLLVHCEQGLGDTLQFFRYIPLIIQRGGPVVVAAHRELLPLLASSGYSDVEPLDAELPRFDVHVPLMSVPHIFGTELATIPRRVPYLAAQPEQIEKWRGELQKYCGLKVGIVWQGRPTFRGDRLRSVPLVCFAPLALPNVHLLSLQKGAGSEQLAELAGRFKVIDLASRLDNSGGAFMDTAAVMRSLDVVITTDTAAAHLAGALGVRVWVALSVAPEWRWMTRRADSPWYPTMRLFRQTRAVQWSDVFKRMAGELAKLEPGSGQEATIGNPMPPQ